MTALCWKFSKTTAGQSVAWPVTSFSPFCPTSFFPFLTVPLTNQRHAQRADRGTTPTLPFAQSGSVAPNTTISIVNFFLPLIFPPSFLPDPEKPAVRGPEGPDVTSAPSSHELVNRELPPSPERRANGAGHHHHANSKQKLTSNGHHKKSPGESQDSKEDTKKDGKPEKPPTVPYRSLYRYADGLVSEGFFWVSLIALFCSLTFPADFPLLFFL